MMSFTAFIYISPELNVFIIKIQSIERLTNDTDDIIHCCVDQYSLDPSCPPALQHQLNEMNNISHQEKLYFWRHFKEIHFSWVKW